MNTNTYIKKGFDKLIKDLACSKGYNVIKDPIYDIWKLFNKDKLAMSIQMEIMDSISLVEIIFPICDNIGVAEEIFMKLIVTEHCFREILGGDILRRVGNKVELCRPFKIGNCDQDGSNKLLLNISDMMVKVDRISQKLQSKMEFVMCVKLN